MTAPREEVAIRDAFERRRPRAIPTELLDRLDAMPLEPPRSSGIRRVGLAVLPWAALAAAAIILMIVTPGMTGVTGPDAGGPGDAAGPWDPFQPPAPAPEIGVFGLPWVPMLLLFAIGGVAWTMWRLRTGQSVVPRPTLRRRQLVFRGTAEEWGWVVGFVIPALAIIWIAVAATVPNESAPFEAVSATPGQGRAEVIDPVAGYQQGAGYVSSIDVMGDARMVFHAEPREVFTYTMTLVSTSPYPVRVLGVGTGGGPVPDEMLQGAARLLIGIGLPRDGAGATGLLADSQPFHPIEIPPGGTATLVVAYQAGDCADPDSTAAGPTSGGGAWYDGIPVRFEVFGWRQESTIFLPMTLVAGLDCSALNQ